MSGGMSQSSGVLTITGKWQNKALDCFIYLIFLKKSAIAQCMEEYHRAQVFSQLQVNDTLNLLLAEEEFLVKYVLLHDGLQLILVSDAISCLLSWPVFLLMNSSIEH